MELLEKIDQELKKTGIVLPNSKHVLTEAESKKLRNIDPELLIYKLDQTIHAFFDHYSGKYSSAENYLEELIGMKMFRFMNYEEDSKKQMKEIFLEKIQSWNRIEKYSHFYHFDIQPERNRIRFITSGKDLSAYEFVSPETEKQIVHFLKKTAENILLYFLNGRDFSFMKEAYSFFYRRNYFECTVGLSHFGFLKRMISLKSFNKAFSDSELYDLLELAKSLYQENVFPLLDDDEEFIYDSISPFIYLMNSEQKKTIKKKMDIYFESVFEVLLQKPKSEKVKGLLDLRNSINNFNRKLKKELP